MRWLATLQFVFGKSFDVVTNSMHFYELLLTEAKFVISSLI